eukprot:8649387-Alexandrium_andersonii.AAC.1
MQLATTGMCQHATPVQGASGTTTAWSFVLANPSAERKKPRQVSTQCPVHTHENWAILTPPMLRPISMDMDRPG